MKKYIYSFLFALILFTGFNVNAADVADTLNLDSIMITNRFQGNTIFTLKKYDENNNIWLATPNKNPVLTDPMTIQGTVGNDVTKIECYNEFGDEYEVTLQDGTFTINGTWMSKEGSSSPALYGTSILYVNSYINDEVVTDYIIMDNSSKTGAPNDKSVAENFPTSVKIVNEGSDNNYSIPLYNNTESKVKKVNETLDEVQFNITKEWIKGTIPNRYLAWLSNGDNFIVVNGEVKNRIPFSASSEKYGEHSSPIIQLKEGCNVIGVYSKVSETEALSGDSDWGFDIKPGKPYYFGAVYIINSNGTGKIKKSSNADIDAIDAIQLSYTGTVDAREYEIQQSETDKTEYTIFLPENMPSSGSTTKYTHIYLGVIPKDSGAKWEIVEPNSIDANVEMYQVIDTDGINEVKLKVTAEDGTTKDYTLKLQRVHSDAYVESLELSGGNLKESFARDTYNYDVAESADKITFTMKCSDGTTVKVDGKDAKANADGSYTFSVNPNRLSTTVKVTSEDKSTTNSYQFRYKNYEQEMWNLPDSTKALAKQMLEESGWYARSEDEKNDLSNGYWSVFMAAATNLDTKDAIVYDVTTHEMDQATDWAGCILELILIGENPYNFNGINYVEGLEKCYSNGGYGPYACNIWALEAFKAAGHPIEEQLITTVKNQARSETFDLDMRSWALAAVNEWLTEEERFEIVNSIRDTQMTEGMVSDDEIGMFWNFYYNYANSQTHGCVLSGLTEADVNFEAFCNMGGITPLTVVRDKYMKKGEGFIYCLDPDMVLSYGYNKDIIVGLGDVMNGSNVWARMYLTENTMKSLISKAEKMLSDMDEGDVKQEIQTTLDKAKNAKFGTKDFGINYFALYEAMAKADSSMKKYAVMGTKEDAEKVTALVDAINRLGDVTVTNKAEYDSLKAEYDALDDNLKQYVRNWSLYEERINAFINNISTKADEIAALGEWENLTLDAKTAVDEAFAMYNVLLDDEKSKVKNGINLVKAHNKTSALYVENLINTLPENISLNDEKTVSDAIAAYKALTVAQRRLVLAEYVYKLNDAHKTIQTLKGEQVTDIVVPEKNTTNGTDNINVGQNITGLKKVKWKKSPRRNNRKIKLAWKKQQCSGYEIWMKKSKNNKYKLVKVISNPNKTTYTKTKVKVRKNKKYYFKIRAFNKQGVNITYGQFSNVRKVK